MTGARRRPAGGDTGAALVMALALTTFLGLVMGALLSYSAASVRSTGGIDRRTAIGYDTDGALKTAINQVRNSDFNNDEGRPACADLDVPASDGSTIRVTCAAGVGTGGSSERVAVNTTNTPKQAVLTLGTNAAEAGVAQTANAAFQVQGKLLTSGAITAGTGSVESLDSDVIARGTCTGTVVSRDARGNVTPTVCSAPATSLPADPAYGRPSTGVVYQPLPACDASSTVEFQPGYYDDAVGLSAMMSGTGPCAGKTFLFKSAATTVGYYYFDFHNGEGGGLPTGSRVWTINDPNAEIIGGTPLGWTADVSVPNVPGACLSPLSSTTNKGVEFVFGGDSRLRLTAGAMELCGQYSSSSPPVAIYGTKTGSDTTTSSTLTPNITGTNPTSGPAFANPDRIVTADASAATALVNSTANSSVIASLLVDGYVPLSSALIPAGSVLTSAKLAVVHRDNNADAASRLGLLQVSVTPSRTGAPALTGVPQPTIYQDGPAGTAFHTDTLDLLPALAAEVHDFGFVGMQVRYDAGAVYPSNVTENLDSLRLVLSYKKPAGRGQAIAISGINGVASTANCVGAYPGCPLVETDAGKAVLSVQGTVYAPLAALNIRLSDAPGVLARAGVVLRALQVQVTTDPDFDGPLVEIPTVSTGAQPLDVYFRVYLAGKVAATAKVRYPVTAPLSPSDPAVPGHRNVTVISWTVRPP